MDHKPHIDISPAQLQGIGNGVLAYVKAIGAEDASKLIGQPVQMPEDGKLFCLYNANGAPISISQTFEAAIGNAMEHELHAALVH